MSYFERIKSSLEEIDGTSLQLSLLDPESLSWDSDVKELLHALGAPQNPTLFPYHFLARTFPKIGGEVVVLSQNDKPVVCGFAFPREAEGEYLLRTHPFPTVHPSYIPDYGVLADWVSEYFHSYGIGGDNPVVTGYDPKGRHTYVQPTDETIARPTYEQAQKIRLLQKHIWGGTRDQLYPYDIHSLDMEAPSLVYRDKGMVKGCAFGFWSTGTELPDPLQDVMGKQPTMQESQLVGVLPTERQGGVADKMKRAQRMEAMKHGVRVMRWTCDPLLSVNNHINLGKLGGCAMVFHPDYYPFENALNRVGASRFELIWMLQSQRVEDRLRERKPVIDMNILFKRDDILVVNGTGDAVEIQRPNQSPLNPRPIQSQFRQVDEVTGYPIIAIEIPADWASLQQHEICMAQEWRGVTDEIFKQYIGADRDTYMITDVAAVKDENGNVVRAFLLGQTSSEENLKRVEQGMDALSQFRNG